MFQNVNVPILGIIENMAGFVCPKCEEVTYIFMKGGGRAIAEATQAPLLGSIPLDPRVTEGGDAGDPIVHKYPDSAVAKVYRDIAAQIVAVKNPTFQPMSLEWK
jgi:ATP-binding protein involved in chromosome partitioning